VDDTRLEQLPTAALADALVRLEHPVRMAPPQIRPLTAGAAVVGRAIPVRHFGSVDVFLEAFESAVPGGVLVIDNDGRDDEGCIGDLTVAEALTAHVGGIALWGFHRDTRVLRTLGLAIWSLGARSPGPTSARPHDGDPFSHAQVGAVRVAASDIVAADDDGVVFIDEAIWPDVSALAAEIFSVEQRQAALVSGGMTLREQLAFREYLTRRIEEPDYTFRRHLAKRGGAIET
jgi:4-hydroxy-4-methyl-2-oxoglutarate aldolase